MHQVSNPIQACNDIFFRPNGVFHAIGEKHNWSWLPFLIVMAAALLPGYLYFSIIDIDWYKQAILIPQMGDVSPAEKQQFADATTRGSMMIFALFFGFVSPIVVNAILATYLNLSTKADEENLHGFTDWYGFTWWISMPYLITAIVSIALIYLNSDYQISPTTTAPTSLAYLLSIPLDSKWLNIGMAIRLDSFWSIYLILVGVSRWTRFNTRRCAIIAIAPFAILWSIWALIIMSS